MFEDKIRKLNELKNKIALMKDGKEKALLIKDYDNILYFLQATDAIKDSSLYSLDYFDYELYDKRYYKENKKMINDIIENRKELRDIFQKIIDYYHEHNVYTYCNSQGIKIDKKKMHSVLPSFFWNMGDDVFNLFNKMVSEKRIVKYPKSSRSGVAINTMNSDFAYIIIAYLEDEIDYYVSISHEMGHIYEMYLQKNHPFFVNVYINSEVMSLTFEKLFYYFLVNNNILPIKTIKAKEERYFFNLVHYAVSNLIFNLYDEGMIKDIDKDNLEVSHLLPEEELLKRLQMDCGYVYKKIQMINLSSVTYAIGDIISNYFYYLILYDFELGINKLKDFVTNSFNMTIDEIMKKYLNDLTITFDDFDMFLENQKKYLKK